MTTATRINSPDDDSLDAFGVHGIGGMVGALLTGVFASELIGGVPGVIDGHWMQVVYQLKDIVVTVLFAGIVSLIILKVLDATVGLRVEQDDEVIGLDQSQHGETGYSLQ